ncbi:hypothetical protein [Novosphingobium sp.]|uniref:hypothetical protein n=1 Tax=Novosphingobium sp. TaxID=1874826 RepID=UPI00286BE133|nr:hypothetical protein [Novosphingobium sp.]
MAMRFWKAVLWVAAAFNLLVAVPSFFVPGAAVNDRIVALLVGCFGLVYAMVARAPERLGQVLWAGVLGKIGVVALIWPEVQAGRALPGTGWILLGDMVFTALFVVFLLRRRAAAG